MRKTRAFLVLSAACLVFLAPNSHAGSLAGRTFNRTFFLANFSFDPPYGSFAGLTFDALTQTFFVTDNALNHVFEVNGSNGALLRTIDITGLNDAEGIAWMYGRTFALALHDGKELAVVNILSTTTAIARTEATIYDVSSGPGKPKGLTYAGGEDAFYWVAKDTPKAVVKSRINPATGKLDTVWMKTVDNLPLTDLSDVAVFPRLSPHLFLISESSQTIIEADLSGTTAVMKSSFTLAGLNIPQAGALAFGANANMLVVGKHVSGVPENDFSVFSPTATIVNRSPIARITLAYFP